MQGVLYLNEPDAQLSFVERWTNHTNFPATAVLHQPHHSVHNLSAVFEEASPTGMSHWGVSLDLRHKPVVYLSIQSLRWPCPGQRHPHLGDACWCLLQASVPHVTTSDPRDLPAMLSWLHDMAYEKFDVHKRRMGHVRAGGAAR